jgi:hypothetical protein
MSGSQLGIDPRWVTDLAARFRAACTAALRACAPGAAAEAGEDDLLRLALLADSARAQRLIFDNSLRLGRGFRRYHGVAITLQQLPALLSALDAPCAGGVFSVARGSHEADGVQLMRPGCAQRALGAGACDVWHEALHGLVLGLTDGVFHTRHASVTRGGEACVDVFHAEGSGLRYGAIPDDVRVGLEQIARTVRAFDSSLAIDFLGINDGALHYRLSQAAGSRLNARTQFERHVRKRFPQLSVHEASPRPVMAS